jgi:hypothetical protein
MHEKSLSAVFATTYAGDDAHFHPSHKHAHACTNYFASAIFNAARVLHYSRM